MDRNFLTDIENGLSAVNKYLPSKYFYDEIGDALFVEIMNMPEYYLTNAEFDIFKNQTQTLIEALNLNKQSFFELVELGAGDGTKTLELLKVLDGENYNYQYSPIDISENAVNKLQNSLSEKLPNLLISPKVGDYFEVLNSIKNSDHPIIVLFLGSNIGNLPDDSARRFIHKIDDNLKKGDKLLLGVDLIKPKNVVLPAYNDKQGITKRFNLNLLTRINNQLDGNFNVHKFDHAPEYSEEEGIATSYLVSLENQAVTLEKLSRTFIFKKNEKIHMEISRKYNDEILKSVLAESSFKITDRLTDSNHLFADYILEKQ